MCCDMVGKFSVVWEFGCWCGDCYWVFLCQEVCFVGWLVGWGMLVKLVCVLFWIFRIVVVLVLFYFVFWMVLVLLGVVVLVYVFSISDMINEYNQDWVIFDFDEYMKNLGYYLSFYDDLFDLSYYDFWYDKDQRLVILVCYLILWMYFVCLFLRYYCFFCLSFLVCFWYVSWFN